MIHLFKRPSAPGGYPTRPCQSLLGWCGVLVGLLIGMAGCDNKDEPEQADRSSSITFLNQHTITFADTTRAQALLQTSDKYTQQLGSFDGQSKTGNSEATTEADYLSFAAQQARAWSEEEITQLRSAIASAEERIQALELDLALPSEIVLVRSTMQEEGGAAGYTRQNFIVLGDLPPGPRTEYLFLHELFHVYSRYNPEQRDALYETIGFQKTNEIMLPPALESNKISNPDAPVHDHVIELTIDSQPQSAIFFLYSDRDYEGGSFFEYLNKRLLLVEESEGQYRVLLPDGEPVLLDYEDATDLRDKIGRNTNYDIDPEEVMADHFTLLVLGATVPEPTYLEEARAILQ